MRHPLTHFFHRFHKDQDGSVLFLLALGIFVLIAAAGASVDLGIQQLVHGKTQQAADAAATSAASLDSPNGVVTDAQRAIAANRYFNLNFPDHYVGVNRPAPSIAVTSESVKVSANSNVPTVFFKNLGVSSVQATGASEVGISRNASRSDMDIVVVIDESGSTAAQLGPGGITRMTAQRNAIAKFIQALLPPGGTPTPNVRVGLVGYSAWISNKWGLTSNGADLLVDIDRFRPERENFDHWGISGGINMVTGGLPIGINETVPRPKICTLRILGVCVQNRYWDMNFGMPAPRTSRNDGRWSSPNKVIVFVTDGKIMLEPGRGIQGLDDPTPGPAPNYGAFIAECLRAKQQGITVYTTVFAEPPNIQEISALTACASINPVTNESRYMYTPDEDTLTSFLLNTSETLKKIRIIK